VQKENWLDYFSTTTNYDMEAMNMTQLILRFTSFSVMMLMLAGVSIAKIDPEAILGVWLLDDIIAGNTVKDSSDNGRDGTIEGNTKLVGGQFGKALEFDGTSTFVDVPVNLNDCPEVTEVVWTYTHKLPPGERYQIISNDGGSYGRCLMIRPANYWIFHTEGQAITHPVVPTLNSWEHLAATWTTKEVKFYIDGKVVAKGIGDSPVYNDTVTVNIGRCPFRNGDFYAGVLDEVALFNVALADDDILDIAQNGLGKALGIAAVSGAGKLTTTWASIKAQD
jgi:hypothetical protein